MNKASKAAQVAALALAFGTGGICLAAALLAQGGRFDPRLDLLAHFAPFWLAGAVATALTAMGIAQGGVRAVLLALGAAGVVAAGTLIAPEFFRPIRPVAPRDTPGQIRLIQLNAWERNADPVSTANWIASEHPNVVTIEDVTPTLGRALVARGFHRARGMVNTTIFSRDIASLAPFRIPMQDWPLLPDFARARFEVPGGRGGFSVVAVHLTRPYLSDRVARDEDVAVLLDRQPRDALIIAGDFNLTPWSFALRRLDRRFGLERRDRALATWPACPSPGAWVICAPPFLPIDHIYAGSAWRTVRIARGPRLGSDHYPLVVDLALSK